MGFLHNVKATLFGNRDKRDKRKSAPAVTSNRLTTNRNIIGGTADPSLTNPGLYSAPMINSSPPDNCVTRNSSPKWRTP